jgi:cytochrome c peroxidase
LGRRNRAPVLLAALISIGSLPAAVSAQDRATIEELGKKLFFDASLSQPRGQSCAGCHDPATGFTSPNPIVNLLGAVVPGARAPRAGNRKPPSAAYATLSAPFDRTRVTGGSFWDGRATGEAVTAAIFPDRWPGALRSEMSAHLGPAVDQAMGPFLADVEMNLPSAHDLCKRVRSARYAHLYARAFGEPPRCDEGPALVDETHQRIAFAIAVYEGSDEVNSFSSRRDEALANDADGAFPLDDFTPEENLGRDLFYTRQNGCARFCHSNAIDGDGTDPREIHTASGFFNIGTPRNPFNPWYRMNRVRDDAGRWINPFGYYWVDLGVGARDDDGDGAPDFPGREGRVKAPTLRNVAKRPFEGFPKAYTHNGYFKSLESIVHFYNTRDTKPVCRDAAGNPQSFVPEAQALQRGCWPEPEVSLNVFQCGGADAAREDCKVGDEESLASYCDDPSHVRNVGNLCLSPTDEDAIVAYLKTLDDTVTTQPPRR